jgi:DNA-binding transcriptional regulator YhcF (GntR family)
MGPEPRLYEQVAAHVAGLIERGALRAGDRVPSVRRLSRQQGVSVATVIQAYLQLEGSGLIEVRPQSGHYVRRRAAVLPEPRAPRTSTTASRVSVAGLVAKVYGAARDPHIVPFGAAYPSPELLPTERLNATLARVARASGAVGVSYDPPPGCPALRRQIARRSVEQGCALTADELVTTVGAMEALNLCLRAVAQPGDTVAIESPANRQIANGFSLGPSLKHQNIQILPSAGGWTAARDKLLTLIPEISKYPERVMVLLVDFDGQPDRLEQVLTGVPDELRERIFVLGASSVPEKLRSTLGSYEKIGRALAEDCAANTTSVWGHELLAHNVDEAARLLARVRSTLF